MNKIEFESYKIAHDLPEVSLTTWIHHDKPSKEGKTIRTTSVTILTESGDVFAGVSGCSESDQFEKKDGFNRAYGRACQKLAHSMRGYNTKDGTVDLSKDPHDIDRWVTNIAFQAKIDFLKNVYASRLKKQGLNMEDNV